MPRCCLARGLCLQPGGLPGGAAVPGALACTSHNCSRGEGGKDTRKKEHSGERARNSGRRGGDSKTWWPRVETSSQLLTQEAHSFLGWLFFPITVLPMLAPVHAECVLSHFSRLFPTLWTESSSFSSPNVCRRLQKYSTERLTHTWRSCVTAGVKCVRRGHQVQS